MVTHMLQTQVPLRLGLVLRVMLLLPRRGGGAVRLVQMEGKGKGRDLMQRWRQTERRRGEERMRQAAERPTLAT